ncbi:MAG: GAF domain-containing protein [Pseudomonadota bacterium]|nr:GAF domain-containing protein [Pseudomonadota bacterium]
MTLNKHEGLVGFVGDRAEPLNLNDAQSHPRNRFIAGLGEEPFHSFLGVPIIHHRKVLGVLVVQQKETRRFNESEESFLITLSAQLAGVIAHAILSDDLLLSDLSDHSSCLEFRGVSVSGGVGFGTAFVFSSVVDLKSIRHRQIKEIPAEIYAFNQAVKETREEIKGFSAQLEGQLKPSSVKY